MPDAKPDYRPTQTDVLVAKVRAKAADRLGEPVPDWVHEVFEMAERNGVERTSHSA